MKRTFKIPLQSIQKWEPALFWLLLLFTLLPIVILKYYVTADGPAHLYNGNLLKELLVGSPSEIQQVFTFNSVAVPNVLAQFIFGLLRLIFPDWMAEKILMLCYFILTPIFFRQLILRVNPTNRILTYLIFPFLHNQIFYYGFFNMILGILLMFVVVYLFQEKLKGVGWKSVLVLMGLMLLLYLAHVFVFMIVVGLLVPLACSSLQVQNGPEGWQITNWTSVFRRWALLGIAALPSLVLTCLFFIKVDSLEGSPREELSELLGWIIDIRPLLALRMGPNWKHHTWSLFVLFCLMIGYTGFRILKNRVDRQGDQVRIKTYMPSFSHIWLLVSGAFFALFLILPNSILLTERLILMAFLFLILWLGMQSYPLWIKWLTFGVLGVFLAVFIPMYIRDKKKNSDRMKMIRELATAIPEGSLTLPLNYQTEWTMEHSTGYIGSDHSLAVLENYSAGLPWFPVVWDTTHYDLNRMNQFGVLGKDVACDFMTQEQTSPYFSLRTQTGKIVPIPYVFFMGEAPASEDACYAEVSKILKKSYEKTDSNACCALYELKDAPVE